MPESVMDTVKINTPVYVANEEECQAHENFLNMILKKTGHVMWLEKKEKQ